MKDYSIEKFLIELKEIKTQTDAKMTYEVGLRTLTISKVRPFDI